MLTKENYFFHSMDSVYTNKLMDSLSNNVYKNMIAVNTILNTMGSTADLRELNTVTYHQQISEIKAGP